MRVNVVVGADVHGVGCQHEGGTLRNAIPHDHHVLVSLPVKMKTTAVNHCQKLHENMFTSPVDFTNSHISI